MVTLGPLGHWVSSLNLIFCFNLGAGAQTEGEFVGPDPLRPWSPRLGYSRVRGLASADVVSRRVFGHAKTIGAVRSSGGRRRASILQRRRGTRRRHRLKDELGTP